MHRAISRVIRGTCRKWRDNECPAVSTEEVRKGGHKKNEEFVPPSQYTLCDAIGWTAGLVLAYEVTHRRRRTTLIIEERPQQSSFGSLKRIDEFFSGSNCPFGWPTKAITQPIFPQTVYVKSASTSTKKASIDLTPFLKDELLVSSDFGSSSQLNSIGGDDDDLVQFSNDIQNVKTSKSNYFSNLLASTPFTTNKQIEVERETDRLKSFGKLTGDLLGALGAFKFMKSQAKITEDKVSWTIQPNSIEEPPLTAMELMEKGASLGSARALYNIGVAYERLNETQLAREYFRKASDLGHPLATYNNAVYLLRDGKISDGLKLMSVAAENGVPEAKKIIVSSP